MYQVRDTLSPDKMKNPLNLSKKENKLYIPMTPANRSMNLANAVSIIVYEAWRQNDFGGSILSGEKNDGEYYD